MKRIIETPEERLAEILAKEPLVMNMLRTVKLFRLRDWYVAAGAVRNAIWDSLHDFSDRARVNDVDVFFCDPAMPEEKEQWVRRELELMLPYRWELVNVGRPWNGFEMRSSAEAIARLPETASCVGVRLEVGNRLTICAPHGLEDLLGMVVRKSPAVEDGSFRKRLEEKRWRERWPRLTMAEG